MKRVLFGLMLCSSAFAQQTVILDGQGRPYMFVHEAGGQKVYMDAAGRPVAYEIKPSMPMPIAPPPLIAPIDTPRARTQMPGLPPEPSFLK